MITKAVEVTARGASAPSIAMNGIAVNGATGTRAPSSAPGSGAVQNVQVTAVREAAWATNAPKTVTMSFAPFIAAVTIVAKGVSELSARLRAKERGAVRNASAEIVRWTAKGNGAAKVPTHWTRRAPSTPLNGIATGRTQTISASGLLTACASTAAPREATQILQSQTKFPRTEAHLLPTKLPGTSFSALNTPVGSRDKHE